MLCSMRQRARTGNVMIQQKMVMKALEITSFDNFGNLGLQEREENLETRQNIEDIEPSNECGDDSDTITTCEQGLENETESAETSNLAPSPPVLRRTQRQSNKPQYIKDYILLAEEEGEMLLLCLNKEPRNFHEGKESEKWTHTCEEEISSIEKLKTWDLVG